MREYMMMVLLMFLGITEISGQIDTCISSLKKHEIQSEHLSEKREVWVSLPLRYDTNQTYPVLYVFDAEWRMELINRIVYDMGGNNKIPKHIIVGIPHVDWREKRGIDLTFSHSRNEYDGEQVDSVFYNKGNSGGGEAFYKYLNEELMPKIDEQYSTSGKNILIGHSYGGYFCSYILSRNHQFSAFQIYDPSIWYSEGEAIKEIESGFERDITLNVFISYQPKPRYHAGKVKDLIKTLKKYKKVKLGDQQYRDETHNSLFLPSFLEGLKHLYKDWDEE